MLEPLIIKHFKCGGQIYLILVDLCFFYSASATGNEKTDFLKEIDLMKIISEGNSPHVVNMVGCVTAQEPLCLITEFMKHGDLLTYLRTNRKQV